MKKVLVICLLFGIACQKGIHWNFASEGRLLKDSLGNCSTITVNGTFITNQATADTNFVTVSVNVTSIGTYSITSDSINGYSFSALGNFNSKGIIPVKLLCIGTPKIAGINFINFYYNNSSCEVAINVLSDTVPKANYTLQGSLGECMDDSVYGAYLTSASLDTSNYISVNVDVQTPGRYSIFSDTVNGYSFSGSGIFMATGVQPVTLNGSGVPKNTGDDIFELNAKMTTCSFSVAVISAVQGNGNLHFPLTAGSYWVYIDTVSKDTIRRYVNGDTIIDTKNFIRVSEQSKHSSQDYLFMYNGVDYNEYGKVEKYSSLITYDPPVYGLTPFLKEFATTGDFWRSQQFDGTASFGQRIYFESSFFYVSNMASKVVSGFGFKDVIIVEFIPYIKSELGSWSTGDDSYYYYYAKGVGLINIEHRIDGVIESSHLQLINWKVN